jgi:hypothetical protein
MLMKFLTLIDAMNIHMFYHSCINLYLYIKNLKEIFSHKKINRLDIINYINCKIHAKNVK